MTQNNTPEITPRYHGVLNRYAEYCEELSSGMFFERHPELSGVWNIDAIPYILKMNKIRQYRAY